MSSNIGEYCSSSLSYDDSYDSNYGSYPGDVFGADYGTNYGANDGASYGYNYSSSGGGGYALSPSSQQVYYEQGTALSSPLYRIGSSGSSASQVSTAPPSPASRPYYPSHSAARGTPDQYQYQYLSQYQNTSAGEGSAQGGREMTLGQGTWADERPAESSHGGRDHCCLFIGCTAKPFKRRADLDRHYKNKHSPEDKKDAYYCDYPKCARASEPFHRRDHFRDHMRDFHQEDITKRGKDISGEWMEGRLVRPEWWRCPKCLTRIYLNENNDHCPTCKTKCQAERMARRRS